MSIQFQEHADGSIDDAKQFDKYCDEVLNEQEQFFTKEKPYNYALDLQGSTQSSNDDADMANLNVENIGDANVTSQNLEMQSTYDTCSDNISDSEAEAASQAKGTMSTSFHTHIWNEVDLVPLACEDEA